MTWQKKKKKLGRGPKFTPCKSKTPIAIRHKNKPHLWKYHPGLFK